MQYNQILSIDFTVNLPIRINPHAGFSKECILGRFVGWFLSNIRNDLTNIEMPSYETLPLFLFSENRNRAIPIDRKLSNRFF